LKVWPLADRVSLSHIEDLLIDPRSAPASCSPELRQVVASCAAKVAAARKKGASVILMYGAHLIKNGAMNIVNSLLANGWVTHLATNGAGTIHDWELSFLGRTEESVRKNVATGTFGTWDETGRCIHLALLVGALKAEGYGRSLGRFITEQGAVIPRRAELEALLRSQPGHPLAPARAEMLQAIRKHKIPPGRLEVKHPWAASSILAAAFRANIPFTVHPGIGYDIISNHPIFDGGVIGRAADKDFRLFSGSVNKLDGGGVLSVGSAIMAPQVFEKSLSCVNNLRLQDGRPIVRNHSIFVVDVQDGGNWDWTKGEPPKTNPAYYLRFCKSFSRMGGEMQYIQCDNVKFLHNLLHQLEL
jgi:hypothetical protein